MLSTIRCGLLAGLCFVAAFAHALTVQVSEAFPLADTIYGPSAGAGKLRSDGRQPFLFWVDEERLSVTRLDGQERVGKLVFPFPVLDDGDFDAVWTGSHFLVVAQSLDYKVVGQLVDASGEPVSTPFTLAETGLWPRVAFNGKHALLLYSGDGVFTRLLTPSGTPAGEPSQLDPVLLSSSELHLASNGDGFAAIVPDGAFTPQAIFFLDANGQRVARQPLANPRAQWALVSNGSRYLAVSAHQFDRQSAAHLFAGDGTPVATLDLQPSAGFQRFYHSPAALWTGTRWLVALYVENGSFTRLLELDPDAARLDVVADRPGVSAMQLASAGGQAVATWQQQPQGVVSGTPLTESTRRVLFAARHQNFLTSATSSTGTLFVWHETEYGRGALRAGFRTHDGRWSERELITGYGFALAASDGTGFVVVTSYGTSGSRIIRLDATGNPLPGGPETFTAFAPQAIASNGSGYVVAGSRLQNSTSTGNLLAAQITGSGVSPVHEIPFEADDVAGLDIASDGERYLVAWGVQEPCSPVVVFCGAERIAGVLLSGSGAVDGPLLRLTEEEPSAGPVLGWNGRDYVLLRNAGALTATHVSRAGVPRDRHVLATEQASQISVVRAADGEVAVAWISNQSARMTLFPEGGVEAQPLTIDDDPRNFPWRGGRLAAIGEGRLAFVFSATPAAAPVHGRQHVMAKIIAPSLPALPPAPLLTVRDFGATVTLQWTVTGPVDGFRVEQRVGDGPWVEIGGWRDADERSLTVRTLASPQFRVRAFNAAGAGPYTGVRRRAVH